MTARYGAIRINRMPEQKRRFSNHTCYLLKNTGESILEVSLRCGYASLSSFTRSFMRIVGMNPTEYRKKN